MQQPAEESWLRGCGGWQPSALQLSASWGFTNLESQLVLLRPLVLQASPLPGPGYAIQGASRLPLPGQLPPGGDGRSRRQCRPRTQAFLLSAPRTSLHRLAIPLPVLWPEKLWLHWDQLGTVGSPAPVNASSTENTGIKEDKTAVSTAQRKDSPMPLTSGAWRMGAETLRHV